MTSVQGLGNVTNLGGAMIAESVPPTLRGGRQTFSPFLHAPTKESVVPNTFAESWGEEWGADCVTFNPDCATKTPNRPILSRARGEGLRGWVIGL